MGSGDEEEGTRTTKTIKSKTDAPNIKREMARQLKSVQCVSDIREKSGYCAQHRLPDFAEQSGVLLTHLATCYHTFAAYTKKHAEIPKQKPQMRPALSHVCLSITGDHEWFPYYEPNLPISSTLRNYKSFFIVKHENKLTRHDGNTTLPDRRGWVTQPLRSTECPNNYGLCYNISGDKFSKNWYNEGGRREDKKIVYKTMSE